MLVDQGDLLKYMKLALAEADLAEESGDVPVGAVLLCRGQVIAQAHNRREQDMDTTAHAEILAIRSACHKLGRWILDDCQLFVSLEPCLMCLGAIIQARIGQVYFAAYDPKTGACGSLPDLAQVKDSTINHHTSFQGGILAEEAGAKLKRFFRQRRSSKVIKAKSFDDLESARKEDL